jgi:3-oxoacyl-[acyl-carrier protein] reductase
LSERFRGKVVIVTGAGSGIGRATALAFAREGAAVGVADRGRPKADAVAAEATAAGGRALALACDVSHETDCESAVRATEAVFGPLDILVNNAGIGTFCEVSQQAPEQWREVIDTNLTGVFHCCHAAIPHLRRRGGGWIINISSLAGKNAFPGGGAYCASKAGLNAFSETLMQEVRYDGIRVSYVLPGSVRTEFAGTHAGAGTEWKLDPDDVARVVVDLVGHDPRSLPSRVEIRPSQPRK